MFCFDSRIVAVADIELPKSVNVYASLGGQYFGCFHIQYALLLQFYAGISHREIAIVEKLYVQ